MKSGFCLRKGKIVDSKVSEKYRKSIGDTFWKLYLVSVSRYIFQRVSVSETRYIFCVSVNTLIIL